MFKFSAVGLVALALGLPSLGSASVIYTYTGNPYDVFEFGPPPVSGGNQITVSLETSAALGPTQTIIAGHSSDIIALSSILDLSISDGFDFCDLFSANCNLALNLYTDAQGNIDQWGIRADQLQPSGAYSGYIIQTSSTNPNCGFGIVPYLNDCSTTTFDLFANGTRTPGVWSSSTGQPQPTPVPEPATLSLTVAGLVTLALRRRRIVPA